MGKIVAITNFKGGVGKTASTLNLGAALSDAGKKVLLIDNDPQGNLTAALGYTPSEQKRTLAKGQYSSPYTEQYNKLPGLPAET